MSYKLQISYMIKMLNQITDSFFSKLTEKFVDYVFDTFSDKKNLESTLETLKNNLNSLSDKAFDVEERIKNGEVVSGKKKRKRDVEEWLKQVKMIENEFLTLESEVQTRGFVRKFLNGDQATRLNAKLEQLVDQSRHFGELLVDVHETRGGALLTTKLSGKGFKENLKRIWNLMKSDQVSSIGIYGMGGVGKTALARHINNMMLEKRKEKRVCWITVSHMFSIKKLQNEIARSIGLNDLSDEDSEDKRAARLNQAIRNNFLLILDDVWENICLEKLGDPLRLQGCKLILTTRSLELCCRMGCQEKVEVKKLHTGEAWNLFKRKQDIALYPDVEKIAKRMAKVCGGLPLGIIVLAGSMRDETSIHVWRNEFEKLRDPTMVQDDKENEFFKVLKYSFDRLDLNHQRCFLHLSLYPEDFEIPKAKLVDRFISEELVDKRKSRQSQFDQCYSILNKLVKVCLLEEGVNEYLVKVHDLVRAMALKITKGKSMVISRLDSLKEIPNEREWTKDLEKVSLMKNNITEIPDGMLLDCPNLTTLIMPHNPLEFISDSFFSQLGSLCFLDLSSTDIEKLPNSLSNLENLKALNLAFCRKLVDIPNLGKLKKLRELDLSGTSIKEVPQGMEELVNLRFLSLIRAELLSVLPKGLFLNFPWLQYLSLSCQIKALVEEIVRLKHLERFWGRVENVSDFHKYVRYRQSQLNTFTIMVHKGVNEYYAPFFMSMNTGNKVILDQCNLKDEEEEDLSMFFHDIEFLVLENCKGLSNSLLDDFPRLNKPSSLKVLKISKCRGIEYIWTTDQFPRTRSEELESHFLPLRNLERIELIGLQNFIGLIQNIGAKVEPPLPQATLFSSPRSLDIRQCNKVRKLGLPLLIFQNLEVINIRNCDEIEEIIEVQEGEGRLVSLPKLTVLSLWDLQRLKSICNTTMCCGFLEIIRLTGCRELKKLPLYFDPTSHSPLPQTLKEIRVWEGDKEWWELLEWEHPTHSRLLQPLLKFC